MYMLPQISLQSSLSQLEQLLTMDAFSLSIAIAYLFAYILLDIFTPALEPVIEEFIIPSSLYVGFIKTP